MAPLWLWGPILGCLTSCGGGILSNIVRSKDIEAMKGSTVPECTLAWGAFFSCYLMWQTDRLNPKEVLIGVIITLIGTTVTVLFCQYKKLESPCMKNMPQHKTESLPEDCEVVNV